MIQPIRRAVWTFWTKPYFAQRKRIWLTEKHHWCAWILSLEKARQHYPETALFTDDEGARILIDGLGLPFDTVHTDLNQLHREDTDWWVLGKLLTYRHQTQPFIHIDADVFLWKALPLALNTAPVLVQNPENFVFGQHDVNAWWYRPEIFDQKIKQSQGWLPQEWDWYVALQRNVAFCTGIFGGHALEFIHHYAELAMKIALHPGNRLAFSQMDRKPSDCILIEQYWLAACLEYHQQQPRSPFREVQVKCLFTSGGQAHTPQVAQQKGYTHLIAFSKRDRKLAQRLEQRVMRDYPDPYQRCLQYHHAFEVSTEHDS